MINLPALMRTLAAAAKEASVAVLQIYNDPSLWSVVHKLDDSPLTAADERAHEIISKMLSEAYPDIPIISEEGDASTWAGRCDMERFFLIDPIDGTQEFIEHETSFSINIAFVENKQVRAGCLLFPVLGELYTGCEGEGAELQFLQSGKTENLHVSKFLMSDSGLRIVCSRSRHNAPTAAYIERLRLPQKTHIGASMKFMYIARGLADLYPRFGSGMKEWDTAASQAVVEAAGGSILQPQTMQPLRYGVQADITVREFICAGKIG